MESNEVAERSLRENIERFRQVFEEGPLGMAFLGLDLKFLETNAHFKRLVGYNDEELRDRSLKDLATAEDENKERQQREALLGGDAPFFKIRMNYRSKDGHTISTITSISLCKDDDGKPQCFLLTFEDITDLLAQNEKLEKMNAKMINNEVEIVKLKAEIAKRKK